MTKVDKKIIVTGSAGFIGFSLSKKLLQRGDYVIGEIIIIIIMTLKLKMQGYKI